MGTGLVFLLLLAVGTVPIQAAAKQQAPEGEAAGEAERQRLLQLLQPGQTPDQVRGILGPPRQTSRQILYHRYLEQWLYQRPFRIRILFNCLRGQEPHLMVVDPSAADNP